MMCLIPRVYVRTIAFCVIATLVFHLSPMAVFASTTNPVVEQRAKALAPVVSQLKNDLKVLETQGKEAYVTNLFNRLDKDEAKAKVMIKDAIERIGARTMWMIIVGWSSPVMSAALAVVPEPWQAAALNYALCRFVRKAIKSMKEAIVRTSATILKKGLAGLVRLLTDNNFLAGNPQFSRDSDEPWWESFFGNSTVVKNFIITIVALGSIGTAIGLAIAGSTAAPIVAVVGALVGLVALIAGGDDEDKARCDGDCGDCGDGDSDDGDCGDGGCPLPPNTDENRCGGDCGDCGDGDSGDGDCGDGGCPLPN